MITAAADGSSLSNPGPSGWAWYIDEHRWAAGGWPRGTNNMGELMAVLDLLRQTSTVADEPLHVLCDSQYVINSVTQWMPGWKRRGWRKTDGKPVLNVDLLKGLDAAMVGRSVSFEWVKGHAGHALNEAADERARAAATAYQRGTAVDAGPGFSSDSVRLPPPVDDVAVVPPPLDLFSEPDPEPGADDVAQVVALETSLLDNAIRSNPEALGRLLHPDFVEHGSSGRVLGRGRALAGLPPIEGRVEVEVLAADRLSDDLIQLRWRTRAETKVALRVSLWQHTTSGWQMRFHQGTPVD